jgi:hypothetical protein
MCGLFYNFFQIHGVQFTDSAVDKHRTHSFHVVAILEINDI